MVIMRVGFFEVRGHLGEIAGKRYVRPFLLHLEFFWLVGTLSIGSGVRSSSISGLAGPGILGHVLRIRDLNFLMLGDGLHMGILLWRPPLIFLLLLSIG